MIIQFTFFDIMLLLIFKEDHMLFKSKQDEETIKRAQQMYGKGINRGLAGFVPNSKKKRHDQATDHHVDGQILLTTTELIPDHDYTIIDEVFGVTTQSQNVIADLGASVKQTIGGELKAYTKSAEQARHVAIKRLRAAAQAKDADAVVGMKFDSEVATVNGAQVQTVVAYGTAVKYR